MVISQHIEGKMQKHSKDIIILGYSGTANECPFDTETWGINIAGSFFPEKKISYCFAFDELPSEYVKEMKALAPVISFQPYADIKYPLKEIEKAFNTKYFVNTVGFMIAYAIYIGVIRLSLYGCDTIIGAMWQRESKGVEYWLGRAEEHGIELRLPPKSGLLRSMQGRIYDKKGREILLTLSERLALLKILPTHGHYNDQLSASTLKWILYPKKDETERYNIYYGFDPSGNYTAICKEEFRIDVPMAEEIWDYLRQCIIDYEKEFGLDSSLLSLYEMFTTSEWQEGEYRR